MRAAVEFARRRRPGAKIAALGESLGGAACLVNTRPIEADAFALELGF